MGKPQGHRVIGGRFVLRSLFKRAGFWIARVRDTRTGRVHFRSTRETTKRRAAQAALVWVEELLRRDESVVQSVWVSAAFEEWLSLKEVRPQTLRQYRNDFQGVLAPVFGKKTVDQITPLDVERFLKELETEGKAPRTRQKHLMALRSFLRWCVRHGYANRNVTEGIRPPRIPKRRPKSLSHDQARRLLQACREVTVKTITNQNGTWTQEFRPPAYLFPLTLLALQTGLRLGNCRRLRWENLDLDEDVITIPPEEMKNSIEFVVPIHPELGKILRELRDQNGFPAPEQLILNIPETDFRKAWKGALERAGLPELKFHEATRKSFASWVSTRCSYAVLKALLGHSLPDVTSIYVNVPWEELKKTVAGLPCLLGETDTACKDRLRGRRKPTMK